MHQVIHGILFAMKKYSFVSITLFSLGLLMMNIALFANFLGLDHDAVWNRSRIDFFLFGVVVVFCSGLYSRYRNGIDSVACKIQFFIKKLPAQYFIFPIVFVVILLYVWFGSSGRMSMWKSHTFYYDNLARGFLNANLYLPIEPDPKLLALPNPYDPSARHGIEVPLDLSLYKGKFYMYWGPTPAMILTAVYLFFDGQVGDLFLTFVFVCGIFLLQTWLLLVIWKYYFGNLPKWILCISISLIGLAGPLMLLRHNYESAVIYEAAITSAQFFLMGGLLAAFIALLQTPVSGWKLAIAGVLWALAIGSRQIVAVPIGFMCLSLAFWLYKTNDGSFKKIAQILVPLGLPLVLGFACLSWYNWARFDSITETGLYYQLAGLNIRDHYSELFSPFYVFQNLQNYLINPIDITSKFPFFFMLNGQVAPFFPFYSVPQLYSAKPIIGLLYTFPFALFAAIPFLTLIFRRKSDRTLDIIDQTGLNFIIGSLSGSSLIAFSLLMMFFWAGMRYAGDFMPSLMSLGVIGFWHGYKSLTHKPFIRKSYAIFGAALAGASIILSILLALSTNDGLVKLMIRSY